VRHSHVLEDARSLFGLNVLGAQALSIFHPSFLPTRSMIAGQNWLYSPQMALNDGNSRPEAGAKPGEAPQPEERSRAYSPDDPQSDPTGRRAAESLLARMEKVTAHRKNCRKSRSGALLPELVSA
jgi:hypothetical protein